MDTPELGNCAEAEVFERATMPELLEGGEWLAGISHTVRLRLSGHVQP